MTFYRWWDPICTRDNHRLPDLVRGLRVASGLSQEELAGRAGLSVRQISDLERGLRKLPRLETMRMLADGLQLDDAGRRQLFIAARPEESKQSNGKPDHRWDSKVETSLGMQHLVTTPLIGRDAERRAIVLLLQDEHAPLVTLTGPGGVGKTRLALAAAHDVALDRELKPVFIDLSPVRDAAALAITVARALNVRESDTTPLESSIVRALSDGDMLLILDNLEQIDDAAASLIASLLNRCDRLKILGTSRVRLQLSTERVYPVALLDVPPADVLVTAESAVHYAAVQLFMERSRAIDPAFALDDANAADIAAICRGLDGLPLAIELAAARTTLYSPAELKARMTSHLGVLSSGPRDAPDRQRTMTDAVAWSYDLLPAGEQRFKRALSVFAGGFSLDAAVAVAGHDLDPEGATGMLCTLVDQHMVARDPQGARVSRFRLLETVRQYCAR